MIDEYIASMLAAQVAELRRKRNLSGLTPTKSEIYVKLRRNTIILRRGRNDHGHGT